MRVAGFAHAVKWTEQDYLRMEAHSPIKHEFFDGELYAITRTRMEAWPAGSGRSRRKTG